MSLLHYLKFVVIGLLVTAAGELTSQLFIQNNGLQGFLIAEFMYVIALCAAYFIGDVLRRFLSGEPYELVCFILFGLLGLCIEWTLLGNAPWTNPASNQIEMFSWWAGVLYIPRIYTDEGRYGNSRRNIAMILVLYSVAVVAAAFISPKASFVFFWAILTILSFLALNFQYPIYFTKGASPMRENLYGGVFAVLAVLAVALQALVG